MTPHKALHLNKPYLTVGFIFILNFILKFLYIDARDVAIDEPFSIYHAQMQLSEIIRIFANENNPPLQEFILHFWIKLFGISPTSVRFPSLLFSCITPVFIYFIGRDFFNAKTGITASLIYTLTTFSVYFAHEARVYSLFALLTSISLYAFLKLTQNKESKKYFVLLFISNLLIIYAHYFGFFVLMIEGILTLIYIRKFSMQWLMLKLYLILFVLFLPNVVVLYNRFTYSTTSGTWVQAPEMGEVYGNLNRFLNNKFVSLAFIIILLINTLYYIISKELRSRVKLLFANKYGFILFLWFAIPYLFMFIVSFKVPMFIDRYILFNSIGFYLFLAFLLNYFINEKYIIPCVGIVLLSLAFTLNLNPDNNREIKKAVELIKGLKTKDNLMIITPNYSDLNLLYYYDETIFKNYKNKNKLLKAQGILATHNPIEIDSILRFSNKEIIYFQAEWDIVDPENILFNKVASKRKIVNQTKVPQIYTITCFSKKELTN